jgi:hypothetical protein
MLHSLGNVARRSAIQANLYDTKGRYLDGNGQGNSVEIGITPRNRLGLTRAEAGPNLLISDSMGFPPSWCKAPRSLTVAIVHTPVDPLCLRSSFVALFQATTYVRINSLYDASMAIAFLHHSNTAPSLGRVPIYSLQSCNRRRPLFALQSP